VLDPELPVRSSPLVTAVATPGIGSEAEFRRRLDAAVRDAAKKPAQAEPHVVVQGALALAGANHTRDPYVTDSASFLTDLDFATLDLSDTDLVVLAACDLAQFEQVAFQGLASMQSAVILARARTVMSSLWRVPDAETAEFMRLFYENLLVRKLPKAEALHATQRAMSVDASGKPRPPFYWAGWTLTGEGW
jgi:CHAT domain-containing protein